MIQTKTIMFAMVMAFALVMLSSHLVLAEENNTLAISGQESNQTLDNKTLAELNDELNESVSGSKIFWKKTELWFTFNNEKIAKKQLDLARLELIRARHAADNNNTRAMEKAIEAHNAYIEKVQKRIQNMDESSNKKALNSSAEKLGGLERAIEVHELRISKLNEILATSNISEEEITKIQKQIDQAENVTSHLKDVELDQKEKLKTKLMAISNMTEQEANETIEKFEDNENLSKIKEFVYEKKLAHAEKVLEKTREKLQERNESGKNITSQEQKIQNFEDKLEQIKEQHQEQSQNKVAKK